MRTECDGVEYDLRFEKRIGSEDCERSAYLAGKKNRIDGKPISVNDYKADNLRWAHDAGYHYQQYTEFTTGSGL